MTTPAKPPTGIRHTPTGWRAFVRIHQGPHGLKSKTFPSATALIVMRRWREEQRVRHRIGAALPIAGNSLRNDVRAYLEQRATMPSLRDRRDDLDRWIRVFGAERIRQTITAGEIRAQLEAWKAAGYAANTCNHRRTALVSLWTVLDGRSAPNPAKDTPKYRDDSADGAPRALSGQAIALLLELLRTSRADPQTRARLELRAFAGWTPAQIGRLTPEDIRWHDAVRLRPRRKGKGAAGVWLPLLPAAWRALEAFKKAGAWGEYRAAVERQALRRLAAKARASIMLPLDLWRELEDITPTQLRHSFGTLIAGITKDDRAVQTLMQHSNLAMTHRYTSATADPRALAALQEVTRQLQSAADSPQVIDSKQP